MTAHLQCLFRSWGFELGASGGWRLALEHEADGSPAGYIEVTGEDGSGAPGPGHGWLKVAVCNADGRKLAGFLAGNSKPSLERVLRIVVSLLEWVEEREVMTVKEI